MLYPLSYRNIPLSISADSGSYVPSCKKGVDSPGIEPGTPALSGLCSNHLSYEPLQELVDTTSGDRLTGQLPLRTLPSSAPTRDRT